MSYHLDELVQNYLAWLKEIKKAPYHTFRAYQVDLIQFLKYFLSLEINDIPSLAQTEEYLATIKTKYNYASYRRKVTVLRNFITYLVDSGINIPDPLISISLPMPNINFNLPVEFTDILKLIENLKEETLQDIRDKLIISLISKSGLTIKQLRSLKFKDLNLASCQIILSHNQLTFIDEKTASLIEKYIARLKRYSDISLDDCLIANYARFENPRSRNQDINCCKLPLSTRTINSIVDKVAKESNCASRLSPTVLRRLFAKSLSDRSISQSTKELIFGKKCRLVS